jgi:molybdopterin adenylyltransferase
MLQRELPGMAEAMRAAGLASTAHAMLSRQLAGVIGRTLVLVLPGSTAACEQSLNAVWPALPHALALLASNTGSRKEAPA